MVVQANGVGVERAMGKRSVSRPTVHAVGLKSGEDLDDHAQGYNGLHCSGQNVVLCCIFKVCGLTSTRLLFFSCLLGPFLSLYMLGREIPNNIRT